jgi:hypothetical protein
MIQQAGYQEVPYWLLGEHYLKHMPFETRHNIILRFLKERTATHIRYSIIIGYHTISF